MQIQSHRYFVYQDKYSELEIQKYNGDVFLHSIIRKWSPSVARNCYSVLNTLFQQLRGEGYTVVYAMTPNPRFAAMFGATSILEFKYENTDYEVVKWELVSNM